VAFGVSATALLVVALVKLGLPIHGGLVLTGSLLRFLPGPALVSGMHDFIDGALSSGTVRLTEVVLLGAAIAGAASLVLTPLRDAFCICAIQASAASGVGSAAHPGHPQRDGPIEALSMVINE
jgi:Putative threonine/serine exporter